jgi:hypothetical protein
MATPRYSTRTRPMGRRHPSLIELALAVSVIIGLGFVSLRVKTMGFASDWTQATESSAVAVKTQAPLATDGAETKTP